MTPSGSRIVLVRHGQSRATVEGFAGGERGCLGLTDLGRLQARALAERWAATDELGPVARLLSSTLRRAVETAEILAPALGLAIVEDAALNEMEPGEGDGLPWDEWERRYGYFDLAAEPFRPLSPGGESWAGFGLRATTALAGLGRAEEGTTVVVCHGGIIEQSSVLGFGLAAQTPPGSAVVTPPNTSVTEWSVEVHDGALRWRLVRFADAGHLAAALAVS